jgi:hypothetical protein
MPEGFTPRVSLSHSNIIPKCYQFAQPKQKGLQEKILKVLTSFGVADLAATVLLLTLDALD